MTSRLERTVLGLSLRFWLLILAMALVRFGLMFGTGPIHDEAYYWSWSQRLDFGYYDQPFLTGWLLWPFVTLLGDHAWVLRLVATSLTLLTTLFLALILNRLSTPSRRVANEPGLMLLVATSPLLWGLGLLYVHDTVMMAFLFAGSWLGVEALTRSAGRLALPWWIGAGALLGLAFSAKLSAALWIFALGLGLLCHRNAWSHLRSLGPWIAAALVLLNVALFLLWNGLNDWVTFSHVTGEHMSVEASSTVLERLGRVGLLWLVVLLLTGPAAMILVLRFGHTLLRSPVTLSLALFVLVPLLAFTGLAWLREVYLNWIIASCLGLMVLGGLFWPLKTRRWHLIAALPSAVLCLALLLPILFKEPRFMLANARDMLGWERSMERLIEYRDSEFPGHSIVGNYYHLAAQTAFHQAVVLPSVGTDPRPHQFKLYGDPQGLLNAPLLVLTDSLETGTARLEADFCHVQPVAPWPVNHRVQPIAVPYLFEVRRPKSLGACSAD